MVIPEIPIAVMYTVCTQIINHRTNEKPQHQMKSLLQTFSFTTADVIKLKKTYIPTDKHL